MKKRIISMMLTICMVLMFVPTTAFAADSDDTELRNQLNSGGMVQLTKDYSIDRRLEVTNTVTLDLNGYTITMTGTEPVMEVIGGNLTVTDSRPTATHTDASLPAGGVITGGNAMNGGGVYVYEGSFTLQGGTIYNCATTEYGSGGGVNIYTSGSFTMNGGTIENCSAANGGGVYVSDGCTFTMNGGTIENCQSRSSGGGIYVSSGTYTMGGGAIKNCSSIFSGGGLCILTSASGNLSTFTMSDGIIENCTSNFSSESAAIFARDSSIFANGGIVKGMVDLQSNSTIQTTSSYSYTKFYDKVKNGGTISSGVYYGGIQDNSGTVSGTYHTVSFDSNGGSGSIPTQWFVSTDKAPALQPATDSTKDGYAFVGWYSGDTKYDFTQPVTQGITLTAKFSNPFAYYITYTLDGGTATNPTIYTVESEAITLNNPTKTGYTFTGWSGTGLTGENNMNVTIAKGSIGNRAYTAHFSQNSYTVTFDTVGGSSISDKKGVTWTDKVLDGITNPTKDGFEFTGWKCGDMTVNANTMYSDLASNDTVTSVTLVAQWKDIQKPVITGLENGKIYCDAVEFEVSDNDCIASVKANDVELTATDGKYTLAKGVGTVTVFAKDNADNETSVTVTVNNGHTGGEVTCTAKAVCEVCGEEYGELDSSNHDLEKIPAKDATAAETGNKEYWHCKDCGKYFADEKGTNEIKLDNTVISKLLPEITEGTGQSITAGEKKEFTFKSNATFSDFIRVELDGVTVDAKNYTATEGSTIITLKADYVATIPAGKHTIGIVSESGTAETTFTVAEKAAPGTSDDSDKDNSSDKDNDTKTNSEDSAKTGDDTNLALWLALMLLAGAGITGTTIYTRRKRTNE